MLTEAVLGRQAARARASCPALGAVGGHLLSVANRHVCRHGNGELAQACPPE